MDARKMTKEETNEFWKAFAYLEPKETEKVLYGRYIEGVEAKVEKALLKKRRP